MPQTPQPAPAPQTARPKPPMPPPELREGAIATMDAADLLRVLSDSGSNEFRKAKACQRLGEIGAREAVPALAALLGDDHLAVYARYGLEPIEDSSAGDALRAALPKLRGNLLIGVINSIGKRRDAKAAAPLARLMHGADVEVARAAAAALGGIGGDESARLLLAALPKARGATRTAVADACLVCAERLLAGGSRDQAMAVYTTLTASDMPKPVRLAAMSAIVREETSLTRPR